FNYSGTNEEFKIAVSNDSLSPGLNTIRLLDSNLKQVAERLIYIHSKKNSGILLDSIPAQSGAKPEFSGKTKWKNANLSIAVLPEETMAGNPDTDLISAIRLYPYIKASHKITAMDL